MYNKWVSNLEIMDEFKKKNRTFEDIDKEVKKLILITLGPNY
jgi:hypothetical protein